MKDSELFELLPTLPRNDKGCIIWTGKTNGDGQYPRAWLGGKDYKVTRYLLEKKLGRPLASGMLACHSCDNHLCVNDQHLFEGTHLDNMKDMVSKNRAATGDRNGARLYPEKWKRGDEHYSRLNPELLAKGSRHKMSKLTEEDIPKIRRLAEKGMIHREIGSLFNVGQVIISAVVRGATWKHVP